MSARHVGRRAVAGSGLAMLVMAAAAAGSAKAEELDGELLAAVAELQERVAEHEGLKPVIRGPDGEEADRVWKYCDEFLFDRMDELVDTITDTPAQTPEGIRAKASALELWLNRWVVTERDGAFEDEAEPHEFLAMSLARDLLGRTAG